MERQRPSLPPDLGAVLGKIVERKPDAAPVAPSVASAQQASAAPSMITPGVAGGFPEAFHRSTAGGSRFKQQLLQAQAKRKDGGAASGMPPREAPDYALAEHTSGSRSASQSSAPSSLLNSGSLAASSYGSSGDIDLSEISRGNASLLSSMTADQLKEAMAEVSSLLSAETLAKLKARHASKAQAASSAAGAAQRLNKAAENESSDALAALAEGSFPASSSSSSGANIASAQPTTTAAPSDSTLAFDEASDPSSVHLQFSQALGEAARQRVEGGHTPTSYLPAPLLAAYLSGSGSSSSAADGGAEHPAAGVIRALQSAAVAEAGFDPSGMHASATKLRFDLHGRLLSTGDEVPSASSKFRAIGSSIEQAGDDEMASALAAMAVGDNCDNSDSGSKGAHHMHSADGHCCSGNTSGGTESPSSAPSGHTLSDLLSLLRSRVVGQRVLGLRALAGLLTRRRAAFIGRRSESEDASSIVSGEAANDSDESLETVASLDWLTVEAPSLRSLALPPLLPVLLRAAMDDTSLIGLQWGLSALAAFVCPLEDEEDGLLTTASAIDLSSSASSSSSPLDTVTCLLSLLSHSPPPLVTAQPPSVSELTAIEGQGVTPLALRNCDPAERLSAASEDNRSSSGVRSAGQSASDGLDCLIDPLTTMTARMGLVERIGQIVGQALAPLAPARPGRPSVSNSVSGSSCQPPVGLLLPCLHILTMAAQRSPAAAERIAGAVVPLPGASTSSVSGSGGRTAPSVPLIPLLVDTLLCSGEDAEVLSAVRRAVGQTAAGDVTAVASSSPTLFGRLSLASCVMALLLTLVRSSRAVAVALCESEQGIEAVTSSSTASDDSNNRAWPGRVTLESLVQFLPLAATAATASAVVSGAVNISSGLSPATSTALTLSVRCLCLLRTCWAAGYGLDLLPTLYAPSSVVGGNSGGSGKARTVGNGRGPMMSGQQHEQQSVTIHDSASGASSSYEPPLSLPGLRCWVDALPAVLEEADAEQAEEEVEQTEGFATLSSDVNQALSSSSSAVLPAIAWRLLMSCGVISCLSAAASIAAAEAVGGHGAAERMQSAMQREASGSASSNSNNNVAETETPPEVAGSILLLCTQTATAVSHAVGIVHEVMGSSASNTEEDNGAPPSRLLVAGQLLSLLSTYLATTPVTSASSTSVVNGEPFPVLVKRVLSDGPSSSSASSPPLRRLSPFYLLHQLALAWDEWSNKNPTSTSSSSEVSAKPKPPINGWHRVEGSPAGPSATAGASIVAHLTEILLWPLLWSRHVKQPKGTGMYGEYDSEEEESGSASALLTPKTQHSVPSSSSTSALAFASSCLSLTTTLLCRWPTTTAAVVERLSRRGGGVEGKGLPAVTHSLLTWIGCLSRHLSSLPLPALANSGTALPIGLAQPGLPLSLSLPLHCAPAAPSIRCASAVAAIGSFAAGGLDLLSLLRLPSARKRALNICCENALLHCLPGNEAAADALTAFQMPLMVSYKQRLLDLLSEVGLGSQYDVDAAGGVATIRGCIPPYPSSSHGPIPSCVPTPLATVPMCLPPHPLWRLLPLQLALAQGRAYLQLTTAPQKKRKPSRAQGQITPTGDADADDDDDEDEEEAEEGNGDEVAEDKEADDLTEDEREDVMIAAALALVHAACPVPLLLLDADASHSSDRASAAADSASASLHILHLVDVLFQLLHVGLLPGLPLHVAHDLTDCMHGICMQLHAIQRAAASNSTSDDGAASTRSIPSPLDLLARHPRYGFRGSSDGGSTDPLGGLSSDAEDGSTLLHTLAGCLVSAYGRGAEGSGVAAVALSVLLQQPSPSSSTPAISSSSSSGDWRSASIRHAVWSGLQRDKLLSRFFFPHTMRDTSLLAGMMASQEADQRIVEILVDLVAAHHSQDNEWDEGIPLFHVARVLLAHSLFSCLVGVNSSDYVGNRTAPLPRLSFTGTEIVRRLVVRHGVNGRLALETLARLEDSDVDRAALKPCLPGAQTSRWLRREVIEQGIRAAMVAASGQR